MAKQTWKAGNVLYPAPAVMVSCGDFENINSCNIITIAWTGTINSNPPKTYISIRPERHSYDIIKKSGEFVINLTTEDIVFATDYCGVKSGKDMNKFSAMNLTPFKSKEVSAPSILESPVNIECKVFDIITLGSHDMFLADIISVTVDDKFMDKNGKFHLENTKPVCYSHGAYYSIGDFIGRFGYSVMKEKTKKKNSKKK